MSVLVEATTVVIRNDAIDRCVPGGVSALATTSPNVTFRTDGKLAAVGFMAPSDVEVYILSLQKFGLRFAEQGQCRDIVVVDQIRGPTLSCDWIEIGNEPDGTKYAWLRGTAPGAMAAFKSWKRGASFTLRTDIGVDQLSLNTEKGSRFYVDERGVKNYLGEAFNAGHPEARMLRAQPQLIREAKRAAWNALSERGWLGIAVSRTADPDFHLAMRFRNQLGLVFVAASWGSTALTDFDDNRRKRLLARAKEVRGLAILAQCRLFAPIHIRSSGEERSGNGTILQVKEGDLEVAEPKVDALTFENVASGAPLNEKRFDTRSRIQISDWELLDFAIQVVRRKLEKADYKIEWWTSDPGTSPHIVATKNQADTRIVVGAGRYPVAEPIFDRDRLMSVAEATLVEGGHLATASVTLAHVHDAFLGDDAIPLYRGEPVFPKYGGLKIVDPTSVFADRAVRIFVSSTFNEFAAERETIARRVVPELQRRASRRGVHVSAVDLRWGVTRAESSAGTAVERCLREVDAAYPFFVGLVGRRHGTRVPSAGPRWRSELKWLAPETAKSSVTELEIRYAMLRPNGSNPSAQIYYRSRRPIPFRAEVQDIATEFRELLGDLRRRGYKPHPIDRHFAEQVSETLWEIISRHYPGVSSPDVVSEDFRKHRQYGLQSATILPAAAQLVRALAQATLRDKAIRIACTSSWEAASLAGALSLEVRKTSSPLIFEHYTSLIEGDAGKGFATRLAEFCRRVTLRVGGTSAVGPAIELAKLQGWAASADRRLIIVIGGTDLFGSEEDAILEALQPSANIGIILTRTDVSGSKPGFVRAQWDTHDIAMFLHSYLVRHRKELDSEDAAAILARPLANNLSYVRFVCDWLVAFALFETLSDTLRQCLDVRDFADLGALLVSKGREVASEADWSKIVKAVLTDPRGCREANVVNDTGAPSADVYAALSVLSPMLESWSGRIWRHGGRDWDALTHALLNK